MRFRPPIFVLASVTCLMGCARESVPTWQRFFAGDDRLIGVKVQQENDVVDDFSHAGKHPAMVEYFMKQGVGYDAGMYDVCQVGFTPDGDIEEVFWWKEVVKRSEIDGMQPPPRR